MVVEWQGMVGNDCMAWAVRDTRSTVGSIEEHIACASDWHTAVDCSKPLERVVVPQIYDTLYVVSRDLGNVMQPARSQTTADSLWKAWVGSRSSSDMCHAICSDVMIERCLDGYRVW